MTVMSAAAGEAKVDSSDKHAVTLRFLHIAQKCFKLQDIPCLDELRFMIFWGK